MTPAAIVILYPLHGAAIMLLCRSRFDRRKTWAICMSGAFLQIALALGFYVFEQGKTWIYGVFSATFLIIIAEAFFLSAEELPQTMFIAMTYTQAFLIITFLAGLLSNWMFHGTIQATSWLRTAFHIAGLLIYGTAFKEKFEAIRRDVVTGWWPICILSVLYTAYVIYITMTAQAEYFHNVDLMPFLFLLAAILTSYAVIFHTIHYMREAAINSQMEQQQAILVKKIEIMEEAEEENRRLRHDFRHHMRSIMEYAKNGETKQILGYLEEYDTEIGKTVRKRLCTNSVIDNVLTVYGNQAEKEGIKVNYAITTDDDAGIKAVDMVAILANLMENAIHGCLESGKGQMDIRVQISTKAGKFLIVVDNTCKDNIYFKNGLPKRKKRRGIGISSIVKSVERYGGNADFKTEEGRFISRIIISEKQNPV